MRDLFKLSKLFINLYEYKYKQSTEGSLKLWKDEVIRKVGQREP